MNQGRIGFARRLAAVAIDLGLTWGVALLVGPILGALFGGALGTLFGGAAEGPEGAVAGAGIGILLGVMFGALVGVAIFGTLYGLIEAFTGASPGKRIIGIKIGNEDGTPADLGRLLGRYAIKNIALLLSWMGATVKR